MSSARPDAPQKLAALRALADGEPGAQEMTAGISNHLTRNGLVELTHLPDGRRHHAITDAGWALLGQRADPTTIPLRSANPPRPGHGIAVGDVVAHPDGRTLSGAHRSRHALVTALRTGPDGAPEALLEYTGGQQLRHPLASLIRVDPPPPAPWPQEL
ncbi:hypothetical protein [Kitasatospora sp. NPDC094015]|uniref:hypothetical protein n=1 Tax=Kitasatospora sp. NPDC094015 TaxID=3155205 RepID=UPI003319A403